MAVSDSIVSCSQHLSTPRAGCWPLFHRKEAQRAATLLPTDAASGLVVAFGYGTQAEPYANDSRWLRASGGRWPSKPSFAACLHISPSEISRPRSGRERHCCAPSSRVPRQMSFRVGRTPRLQPSRGTSSPLFSVPFRSMQTSPSCVAGRAHFRNMKLATSLE